MKYYVVVERARSCLRSVCVCSWKASLFTFFSHLKKSVFLLCSFFLFFIFIWVLKRQIKNTVTTTTTITSAARRALRSKSRNHCAAADMFFLRFRLSFSYFIWEAPSRCLHACVCETNRLHFYRSKRNWIHADLSVHYTLLLSNNILCVLRRAQNILNAILFVFVVVVLRARLHIYRVAWKPVIPASLMRFTHSILQTMWVYVQCLVTIVRFARLHASAQNIKQICP